MAFHNQDWQFLRLIGKLDEVPRRSVRLDVKQLFRPNRLSVCAASGIPAGGYRQVGRFLSADDSSRAEEVAGVSFSLLKTSALSRALLMSLWYRGGMSILLLQGLECIRTGQQKLF
ncbi:unnamed protein product [Closterium sp. NIES-65]|nr:unnamed protein product [Closterium sp. NIES-65]